MKILTLVRHAKSSWDDPGLPDYDRPLSRRGEEDAPLMGQRLAERGVQVDRIITSPAVRALATAEAIADEIGYPWDGIVCDERLYHGDVEDILEVIQEVEEHVDHLMLVGHNPAFTDMANYFSTVFVDMPTCGVVEFRFDIEEWSQVGEAAPLSALFDAPKQGAPRRLFGAR